MISAPLEEELFVLSGTRYAVSVEEVMRYPIEQRLEVPAKSLVLALGLQDVAARGVPLECSVRIDLDYARSLGDQRLAEPLVAVACDALSSYGGARLVDGYHRLVGLWLRNEGAVVSINLYRAPATILRRAPTLPPTHRGAYR